MLIIQYVSFFWQGSQLLRQSAPLVASGIKQPQWQLRFMIDFAVSLLVPGSYRWSSLGLGTCCKVPALCEALH